MTGVEHLEEGERLLELSWNNTVDVEVANFLCAHAHAHFTAALAHVSLETLRQAARRDLEFRSNP